MSLMKHKTKTLNSHLHFPHKMHMHMLNIHSAQNFHPETAIIMSLFKLPGVLCRCLLLSGMVLFNYMQMTEASCGLCNEKPICFNNTNETTSNLSVVKTYATSVELQWNDQYPTLDSSLYIFFIQHVSVKRNGCYSFPNATLSASSVSYFNSSSISTLSPDSSYVVGLCRTGLPSIFPSAAYANYTSRLCGYCVTCFTTKSAFVDLTDPQDGSVRELERTGFVTIFCTATGDPTPTISWYFIQNVTRELIEVEEGKIAISTLRRQNDSVESKLVILVDSITEVQCVASNQYSADESATFVLGSDSDQEEQSPSHTNSQFANNPVSESGRESPADNISTSTMTIIIVGVFFGFCLCLTGMVLLFLGIYLWKRQKPEARCEINMAKLAPQANNKNHLPQEQESEDLENEWETEGKSFRELNSTMRASVSKKLFIPSGSIQVSSVIGQGEFGIVYKGTMRKSGTHEIIAVKALKGLSWSPVDMRNMIDEVMKMERFDHPNVMSLIGVCMDSDGGSGPSIVMPFMAKGSLIRYLRDNRKNLNVGKGESEDVEDKRKLLLQFCWQIAKGMEYISQMKFLHRDLAARNCMIASDDTIKVADFGLAEDIYTRQYFKSSSSEKMPIKWMAPESLKLGIFSEKTDVWSFGVTCWEVFSVGENPYPSVHPHNIIEYLDNGGRLGKPKNLACNQEIYDTMLDMWKEEGENRPHFSHLVQVFETHLQAVSQYMEWK